MCESTNLDALNCLLSSCTTRADKKSRMHTLRVWGPTDTFPDNKNVSERHRMLKNAHHGKYHLKYKKWVPITKLWWTHHTSHCLISESISLQNFKIWRFVSIRISYVGSTDREHTTDQTTAEAVQQKQVHLRYVSVVSVIIITTVVSWRRFNE